MAFEIKLAELPGYKVAKNLYDKIPGRGITKKIILGVGIGTAILAGAALGYVGIAAMIAVGGWLLTLPLLVQIGVLASLVALYSFVVRSIMYVWNFNWQISDKAIAQQIEANITALYSVLGEAVGTSLGYLVCGALPGVVAFAFNPAVASSILGGLNEEAKDEIYDQLSAVAYGALNMLTNALILKSFQGARKWLKRPGTPIYNFLKERLGKSFTEWGNEGKPVFSFAGKVEERVENIKDEKLRNFTEEFLESFSDSCIDAGYIVVNSIGSYIAAQQLATRQAGGTPTVVIDLDP